MPAQRKATLKKATIRSSSPLVSVVTISLNSEKSIRQTITSVLTQQYSHIEYIIVDGGSRDNTLRVVGEFKDRISKVISERDEGISDAFNKGVKSAHGELIQFLNAGDWMEEDLIANAVKLLQDNPDMGYVFGDIVKVEPVGAGNELFSGDRAFSKKIHYVMPKLNHPAMLIRRVLFERYGFFDLRYAIAMDYEWLLRLHKAGVRAMYSNKIRAYMSKGGLSEEHAYAAFKEVRDISVAYGFNEILAYAYFVIRCIKQFVYEIIGRR